MNNYDTSSTGVNLELLCCFDIDLAHNYFEENFKQLSCGGWLFIDNGNVDSDNYKVSKKINITGYSQGDHAQIIVPTNLGFKRGFDFDKYFTNLFYDAPLYCRLTIDNSIDIYLDDFQQDQYSYDKQEIIDHAQKNIKHEKLDVIIDFLGNNLPDQPEYK